MVIVHFFTETFNGGTRSIVRNRGLVSKMAMPREMFPVAIDAGRGVWHIGPQLVILSVACLLLGLDAGPDGHASPSSLALVRSSVAGTALALMFSAANVFFRDFEQAWCNILTNFVRFGVPMIYPFTMVEEPVR